MSIKLHQPFERTAADFPDRIAIVDPARSREVSYGRLDRLADALAADLTRLDVAAHHRVGIYAPKSIPTVAAIVATLKTGGAYVPVDTTAPASRGAEILSDCGVSAVIAERALVEALQAACGTELELSESAVAAELVELGCDLVLLTGEGGEPSAIADLAYVLYTSGSTGKPKGVMHTHSSARSFLDWCVEVFDPTPKDRFSSHAPFHFDLSILDLFVPFRRGATIILIGEEDGKNPLSLAPLISQQGISVWYSTPSVLRLLIEHGGLEQHDFANLRLVLFAGEVFPPGQLRRLQRVWPNRQYFNLYGPTETNVCTYYEVLGEIPPDRVDPYPIGKPITGDRTFVLKGELLVHGGTVMAGYWKRPELDAAAFHIDDKKRKWYRTGDIVKENEDGDYVFLGRRDRMIKRRGYRVELGEIETVLYRHPHVREVAVTSFPDTTEGPHVRAFVSWSGAGPGSTIALKRFCAERLPLYMIPDSFMFLEQLPKTSTDKIDYVGLRGLDA